LFFITTDKKYTIEIRYFDDTRSTNYRCDSYELDIPTGRLIIPNEFNEDKGTIIYLYPGIAHLVKIVQNFGFQKDYEELQKFKRRGNNIKTQINDFEEGLPPVNTEVVDPYGYS